MLILFARVGWTKVVENLSRSANEDGTTVMVNAAVVGGFRDKEIRDPVVVVI